jgi:hypothetical protein
VNLHLAKHFLKAQMGIQSSGSRAHVRPHNSQFLDGQVVQADHRRHPDAPVHRLEGSVTMKKVCGKTKRLVQEELPTPPKKLIAPRLRRADIAR